MLQHDQARPEDVDAEGEDHVADADRYAFLSRPWMPSPEPLPPVLPPGAIRGDMLVEARSRTGRL